MSLIGHDDILALLKRKPTEDPLVVTPLLDSDDQIGPASIDVRLGNQFIVIRRSRIPNVDPGRHEASEYRKRYQERVRIRFREWFDLHPHQIVLGSTLEYIALPSNVLAYVLGKSSWGRLGLVIATATVVSPGYRGTITLELLNLGEVPIRLFPGYPIAQLVLHSDDTPRDSNDKPRLQYAGLYQCATGPDFSRICGDQKLRRWVPENYPDSPDF